MDTIFFIYITLAITGYLLLKILDLIYKKEDFHIESKPKKLKNIKNESLNKPILSYDQSNNTDEVIIDPKIYPIEYSMKDAYNIVKKPIKITSPKLSLPLRKERPLKWKQQRVWQQTFI